MAMGRREHGLCAGGGAETETVAGNSLLWLPLVHGGSEGGQSDRCGKLECDGGLHKCSGCGTAGIDLQGERGMGRSRSQRILLFLSRPDAGVGVLYRSAYFPGAL